MTKPLFLFAPGAGAPSSHPWMKRWARLLRKIGKVRLLDYDYMLENRRRPDRLPVLIAAHRAALDKARKRHRGSVVLIGKSMGSRVGCHVALEARVHAIVCLGYSARWLPGVRLVRGFNSVWDGTLIKEAHRSPPQVGIPLASDDSAAMEIIATLVHDAGFDPVIVGGMARAKNFDVGSAVYNSNMSGPEVRAQLGL